MLGLYKLLFLNYEQQKLCKDLRAFGKYVRALIIDELCKHDYDEIDKELKMRHDYIKLYARRTKKALNGYANTIFKLMTGGYVNVRNICENESKIICGGIEHALLLKYVIKEAFMHKFLLENVSKNAIIAHSKIFPLFYKLYADYARTKNWKAPRVAMKEGGKWYVSDPSAVYIYNIILRAMLDTGFIDMIDVNSVENVIFEFSKKNVWKLLETKEEARVAQDLLNAALAIMHPVRVRI